ncbi:carbohydrate kinase family protein [Tropicimonas sp.]|uniref:carbohydrate kinase family protein n=1 Tax=Tropicimonas sp. TaxID=2067044 RepID=UPI003A85D4A0
MSAQRNGFVTGGIWCLDRNITVAEWPEEDMATTVIDVQLSGGGSACNFAVDIRRLDPAVPVSTMGLLGADSDGDFLQAVAEANGIAHRFHRTGDAATQATNAYASAATGRRTHILFHGAGDLLSPEHFDFSDTSARLFHLGLPGIHRTMDAPWQGEPNGWVAVLRRARAAGFETNLELVAAPPERIRALVLPCLPHLTTLVVNDSEIGALAGRETVRNGRPDPAACREAAREVLAKGAMETVVVHHTAGAHLVARDGTQAEQPVVRVPDAERRGANGAGDAFAAGFHYARQAGRAPRECLVMAHATAAACLRASSPSDAVEGWRTCLSLAETWGWREMDG